MNYQVRENGEIVAMFATEDDARLFVARVAYLGGTTIEEVAK